MKHLVYVVIALQLLCSPVLAKQTSNDFSQWNSITLEHSISKKFKGNIDIQPRFNQHSTQMDMLAFVPSVRYQLTPHISIWQGFIWLSKFNPNTQHENRFWQQLQVDHSFKNISITNRFRLEERHIESVAGTSLRGRYLLKLSRPIGPRWYVITSNELFVNLNSHQGGPQEGFDQNRLFIGFGRLLTEKTSIEIGYQLQYKHQKNMPGNLNHIALLCLKIKV